jgi:hypothetical protein
MANVDPTTGVSSSASSSRAIVTTGPEGLSVSVGPGGVRAGGVGFIIGLLFWLPAELWMGNSVAHMRGRIDLFHFPAVLNAFPAVWLALWTIFGLGLVMGFLFSFWGREQLIVGQSSVTLRATLFGLSRTLEFPIDRVQNVRISGTSKIRVLVTMPGLSGAQEVTSDQVPKIQVSGTSLAFDVRGKSYGFGASLGADTIRTIQDAIERSRKD